nr:uncharacterized protein LOC121114754 [Lepeophtheirus salmonis]
MLQNVSPALYEDIFASKIISIPLTRYLKSISSALTIETGLPSSTVKYLKARIKSLESREKHIEFPQSVILKTTQRGYFSEQIQCIILKMSQLCSYSRNSFHGILFSTEISPQAVSEIFTSYSHREDECKTCRFNFPRV